MIQTTLFPGRYIQGVGAAQRLDDELGRYGDSALLVADPYAEEHIHPDLGLDGEGEVEIQVETFGGECLWPESETPWPPGSRRRPPVRGTPPT